VGRPPRTEYKVRKLSNFVQDGFVDGAV
jgi:hypothetical protein